MTLVQKKGQLGPLARKHCVLTREQSKAGSHKRKDSSKAHGESEVSVWDDKVIYE